MKRDILIFSIGFICATIISVCAVALYKASDIEFTSSDTNWKVTNVEEAIKDIKDNYVSKKIVNKIVNKKIKWEFNYTGNVQEFVVEYDGIYKIETWGAGGSTINLSVPAGAGAYTSGNIKLKANDKLYIYVGGKANQLVAGYNGGGTGYSTSYGNGGGGATDVRLVNGTWDNFDSLKSRIMVAAGGGGAYNTAYASAGGSAGGLIGYQGAANRRSIAYGGTQTAGGTCADDLNVKGLFGIGGNGSTLGANNGYSSGGGGGYYGGSGNYNVGGSGGGAGGGSSFISGHDGCDAIKEESTLSNIVHTGQSVHYSNYKFTDTMMIDGNGYKWTTTKGNLTNMPSFDGKSSMTGNAGNGYAKITLISID